MQFRLAIPQDLNSLNCRAILDQAIDYCREIPDDLTTPWELLYAFINYASGAIKNPQCWLVDSGMVIIGFMVTHAITSQKQAGVYIAQAYILPEHRKNGTAKFCMDILANKSLAAGAKSIECQTYAEPKKYGRFIGQFGYKRKLTTFRKEL